MSEGIQEGWSTSSFGALCLRIVNGGTPDTGNAGYWNGETPWITGADFTSSGIGEFRRFVSEAGIRSSATSVVRQGNLLVVTRTGVGKLAIAPCDIAISQDITGVYINAEKFQTSFVYYLLSQELDELKKLNQGTSINGIVRSDLERHVVRFPVLKSAQRKIANILASIDTAIEKTEALIAKYQQIKVGLMYDLFTRGVLPNGQLRPPRSEAPELYQETPIGWIPRKWEVIRLAECISGAPKNGYSPREIDTWEGVYVLGLGCLTKDGFKAKQLKNAPRAAAFGSGALLRAGDFLISRANTPELVGLCGVYEEQCAPAIYPDLMMRLNLLDFIDKYFLEAQLLLPTTRTRLTALAVGTSSSMAKLNATSVNKFQVFVPPLEEQILILNKLNAIQQSIRSHQIVLCKLQLQKLGLMQDLLTGRVPVQVDESEVVHA